MVCVVRAIIEIFEKDNFLFWQSAIFQFAWQTYCQFYSFFSFYLCNCFFIKSLFSFKNEFTLLMRHAKRQFYVCRHNKDNGTEKGGLSG